MKKQVASQTYDSYFQLLRLTGEGRHRVELTQKKARRKSRQLKEFLALVLRTAARESRASTFAGATDDDTIKLRRREHVIPSHAQCLERPPHVY